MKRAIVRTGLLLLLICASTGCTDFVEPDQLAFVMGTAIDHAGDGMIEVSHQIVIPSQQNGPFGSSGTETTDNFVVVSGKGVDVFEASQNVQRKSTRKLLTSHRVVIAISEEYLQKNDASKLFDKLNRDPANNQRDMTLLVKGSDAKAFLLLDHPMEHLSSIAIDKEMQINGLFRFSTRQFMIDSLTDGARPILPVVQIERLKSKDKKTTPIAVINGFALLDHQLKIAGLLDDAEGANVVWLAGKGTYKGVTIPWKDGKGHLSFRLTHLKRRIDTAGEGDSEHFVLSVTAQAYLIENTTPLDMSDKRDTMILVQRYLNERVKRDLQLSVNKAQQFGADVFGIGEFMHRKFPNRWKSLKGDWDKAFRQANVTVEAKIRLRSAGASGASPD
ncbi:MAG: Ger(x)C family spore germination protein [Paenibacillus sp.]|jgi:spore germination protein KC|nr:Ger(x)C family spore germination protein [Paenibacillus sp.]